MDLKKGEKGVFFTIDSILATGVILFVALLASTFYISDYPNVHLNYLSQDLIKTLSTLTVEEIDNEYINERINEGDITNLDYSVLKQIAEFWARGDIEYANKTVSNVTEPFVANVTGFGVWINNETVYTRDLTLTSSLISSKKIVSGIAKGETTSETRKNPPTLFGPILVEVRVWQ